MTDGGRACWRARATAAGLLLLAWLAAAGCGAGGEVLRVSIRNDTAAPVYLTECGATCRNLYKSHFIQPGAAVAASTVSGATSWYLVSSASGDVLGCVRLHFRQKAPGLQTVVSRRTVCPQAAAS